MKIEKLIRRLRKFLDKGKVGKGNNRDSVDDILKRLEASRDHLQRRLQKEKRVCKRKRLTAQLKIVELKLKKGRKRLRLLDAK
jgi:hypothetical protein